LWSNWFEYVYSAHRRMVQSPVQRAFLIANLLGAPAIAASTADPSSNGLATAVPASEPLPTPANSAGNASSAVPHLHWDSPEGRPSEADFRRRLTEYLGRDVPATATLSAANVTVARVNRAFRVSLQFEQRGQARVRTLDTASCAEALDATALIVALAIDPTVATRLPNALSNDRHTANPAPAVSGPASTDCPCPTPRTEVSAPAPCPSRDSTTAPPTQPNKAPTQPAAAESVKARGLRPNLQLVTELAYRQLPGIALGEGLGAAVEWEHLRVFLTAVTSSAVLREPPKGGDFRLIQGRLSACWMKGARLAIGPCAAMSIGAIRATGLGVTVPEPATELWLSNSVGVMARYWHGDSAVAGVYANVELPWRRSSFELSGNRFYDVPAAGLLSGLFVGLRLD
jgi:hypothetical protein